MTMNSPQKSHHLISLREIAGWQDEEKTTEGILARVPSLQRGLVWEPQQIEMLWDSLFRGFPIGSIVLSQKIDSQDKDRRETTHHILDGQQRCYAIVLGFKHPWPVDVGQKSKTLLWLDLDPSERLNNSTRNFLFRVTTTAHPWGFHHGDQGGLLSASHIRDFYARFGSGEIRPGLEESVPHDAGLPVPLGVLMNLYKNGQIDWTTLADDETMNELVKGFGDRLRQLLKSDDYLATVSNGLALACAESSSILALQVPASLESIGDIEQIFQRLNRQGTPLDNEELAYSMIKAYWPEVEDIVPHLPCHTTEARMIDMSIRVALTEQGDDRLHTALSVDRIRKVFGPIPDREDLAIRKKIEAFFQVNKAHEIGNAREVENRPDIARALNWIDSNLLYKLGARDYGIPKYLRSSMAWSSREVFSWLMLIAKRQDYCDIKDESLAKRILGLALSVHWFGRDKKKAVDLLVQNVELSRISLSDMKDQQGNQLVTRPLELKIMEEAVPITLESNAEYLKGWTSFWQGIVNIDPNGHLAEDERERRKDRYWPFFDKLGGNREMLVYVQRAYFDAEFRDFDPSNKLIWKGHNRPWDYDHILPSNNLNAQGRANAAGDYHAVCKAWQQSLGNLVAVDFSFNREAQDQYSPSKKYGRGESHRLNGFFEEVSNFDLKLEDTQDLASSRKFVVSARNRMIAIYKEWYEELEIKTLL